MDKLQADFLIGRTYANKGSGKTVRKVENLVRDSTDTGWYVRYSSEDGGGFERLGVFAAWAGLEVSDDTETR